MKDYIYRESKVKKQVCVWWLRYVAYIFIRLSFSYISDMMYAHIQPNEVENLLLNSDMAEFGKMPFLLECYK